MLIKAGVDISRLNREIRRALPVIANTLRELGYEMIITSTYEGNHSEGSLHYANDAVDIRNEKRYPLTLSTRLKSRLGAKYDVVYEVNHIHIEYDPK